MGRPVRLFICYASADRHVEERLLGNLLQMVADDLLLPWHDRWTEAGEEWEKEILHQIDKADAALLLVSKAFLQSKFIQEQEIPVLRRRYQEGSIKIFPLILEPCDYEKHDFIAPIQFLTRDRTPLSNYQPDHLRYTHTANHLKILIIPLYQSINQGLSATQPTVQPALPPLSLQAMLEKLPQTSPRLFGREQEMAMLDKMRHTKGVLVWVAGGGTGKSALVRHWLVNSEFPKETRFIGHSFYSQGTKDQNTTSAPFIREVLQQLGCRDIPLDNFEQGQTLAQFVRANPTVLVLDGVEPLQHPPDGHAKLGGIFKDQGLHGLLTELARQPDDAICLVSSRIHLADTGLREKTGRFIWQHDLNHLSPESAVELLTYRGVNGRQNDLEKTAKHYQCYALALVLVSEYLHTFHQGRVEKALAIPVITEKTESGHHAKSVMRAYDIALQKAGEELDREIVRLLGLFDRPAEWDALVALKQVEPIPGLTDAFHVASAEQVTESLARLRMWGLLNPGGQNAPLDAHPLVREWFGNAIQKELPDSFRQAHAVLSRHYQQISKQHPNTLEEMEPLYRAVRHGCLAGEYQNALNKVYFDRIQRGKQYFSTRFLGAYSSNLSAISYFFPNGLDKMPVTCLQKNEQGLLLAVASFLLMSLGRLTESVVPLKVVIEIYEQLNDWEHAAINARNLTSVLILLGRLKKAADVIGHGLDYIEKIADGKKNNILKLHFLASQAHLANLFGEKDKALATFRNIKELADNDCDNISIRYMHRGVRYALFILENFDSQLEKEFVLNRGELIDEYYENRHMEKANGKMIAGLAMECLGRIDEAAKQLQISVAKIRQAERRDRLPLILLSYARFLHRQNELNKAKEQLFNAREIAERGDMRLYLAECALLAACRIINT